MSETKVYWMLFDTLSGNAIDGTDDEEIAREWAALQARETHLAVIPLSVDENDGPVCAKPGEEVVKLAKEEGDELVDEFEPKAEEGPDEPADDTAEAQPSIEREGAAIGSTGGGSSAGGESGGTTQAGNSGGAASSSPGG